MCNQVFGCKSFYRKTGFRGEGCQADGLLFLLGLSPLRMSSAQCHTHIPAAGLGQNEPNIQALVNGFPFAIQAPKHEPRLHGSCAVFEKSTRPKEDANHLKNQKCPCVKTGSGASVAATPGTGPGQVHVCLDPWLGLQHSSFVELETQRRRAEISQKSTRNVSSRVAG